MKFALIVAMSRAGVIGCHGVLPWHLPRDMDRFRELTMYKPVIMGRKTYEAIGGPLPQRTNIVLTRQADYHADRCYVVHSEQAAVNLAVTSTAPVAMVIGGGEIYRTFLPRCYKAYVTVVEGEFPGDVTFPEPLLDSSNWEQVHEEHWPANPRNPRDATHLVLRRKNISQNLYVAC